MEVPGKKHIPYGKRLQFAMVKPWPIEIVEFPTTWCVLIFLQLGVLTVYNLCASQVLPGLSSAHRAVALQPSSIITKIPFNVHLGVGQWAVVLHRFAVVALDATGPIDWI